MTPTDLLNFLANSPNPIAIYSGPDLIIEAANSARLRQWGKDRTVIGKPVATIFPEIKEQPYLKILQEVMATGITYTATDTAAWRLRDGKKETGYYDIVFEAINGSNGERYILSTAIDVTEQHFAKEKEIVSTKEQLKETSMALAESQQQLEQQKASLADFFMKAPTAICIFAGKDLVYEFVNPRYQQILPGKELIGRPVFEVLPEIKDQPVGDILRRVYATGIEEAINEMLVPVQSAAGILEDRYFTFNVQARKNAQGEVDGIFNFVYEVTEQVAARRAMKKR